MDLKNGTKNRGQKSTEDPPKSTKDPPKSTKDPPKSTKRAIYALPKTAKRSIYALFGKSYRRLNPAFNQCGESSPKNRPKIHQEIDQKLPRYI